MDIGLVLLTVAVVFGSVRTLRLRRRRARVGVRLGAGGTRFEDYARTRRV